MPVNANFYYKTAKDASYVTLRNQNRMLYANYRIQQNNVQEGCQGVMRLQDSSVADADIIPKLLEGARETTAIEINAILASESCPISIQIPSPAPAPISSGGSMVFSSSFGSAGSDITFANDVDLSIGTESFTIEWFQYYQSGASFPRVFSIGTYPTADIAVSYEGGGFYFWKNGSAFFLGSEPAQDEWVHVAVVGTTATNIKIYVAGTLLQTVTGSYNFANSSTALAIGNETTEAQDSAFTGRITSFRWVVGSAVYTSNFTPPSQPLTAITGTQLLLLASNETDVVKDSSSKNRTPTNTGVTYSSTTPF